MEPTETRTTDGANAGVTTPASRERAQGAGAPARGFDDDASLHRTATTPAGRVVHVASFAAAERLIAGGADSRDVLIARGGDLDAAQRHLVASNPTGPLEPATPHAFEPRLLVCLPTYNELENLESMVRAILTWLDCDILVVDDDSPDGTGALADRLAEELPAVHVLHKKEKAGLGHAYLAAFAWGMERGYERLFQIDCDFSHAPWDLPRLAYAGVDNELVIGSRYVEGGGTEGWVMRRRMLSKGGNLYAKLFLGFDVQDYTAGFRCYDARLLSRIDLNGIAASGYSFQVEMTWRSKRAKASVKELPIRFVDREHGVSKMTGSIAREALAVIPSLRFGR